MEQAQAEMDQLGLILFGTIEGDVIVKQNIPKGLQINAGAIITIG